ncbi:aminotransferase class I/II-fold pyridoxal phosphate-dependent enzyme [Sporosarcina sp. 179-K 3D1 HS]|uniref:aminotransferase class I/II-fold pyridoxal phosphate-dependent enzyme n=1 Tax=Sporosarcina sp. 179-K 3D1 HS TaxID=3232169 RepID=UPI00399F286A
MTYTDRPLVRALTQFHKRAPMSLHVPGHKNGALSSLPDGLRAALPYDVTELEGLDDLHEPHGAIEEAQQKLAALYGSHRSFFLVNGSTVGNLAMIYATCRRGETVIVQRNAHKSVFHAIELAGVHPVFVSPDWQETVQTPGLVSVEQIEEALHLFPQAKAVVLTYPTYYGTAEGGLEEVIQLCHAKGIPVLVDEAHGAHFVLGDPFPRSALQMGADVVVHSAHKSLPAMTMGSFLHIRSDLVDSERIAHALHMLQSSSPSYLLMASLDDARAYAETYNTEDTVHFLAKRQAFITQLEDIPGLQPVEMDDPLKLTLRVPGYSGFEIQQCLDAEGLYVELADLYQVLVILPLVKRVSNYSFDLVCAKIKRALSQLAPSVKENMGGSQPIVRNEMISQLAYLPAQLADMKSEWISYKDAEGRVAAASVIPYPPGIPLLLGGETVKEGHIRSIEELIAGHAKFQGAIQVEDEQILVVKDGVK